MDINYSLRRETLPETIANRLETIILKQDEKLIVGDKLPSEQTLADNFNVSRPVIREALKILATRGLVEKKNGEGSFISEIDPSTIYDVIKRYVLSKDIDVQSIFLVRISLETTAAKLAAENAKEEDIEELYRINKEMDLNKHDLEKRAEYDVMFHNKIAEMSANPLIQIFTFSMAGLVIPVVRHTLESYGNEEGVLSHKEIVDAIKEGNAVKSEALMREHLVQSMSNYKRATIKNVYSL